MVGSELLNRPLTVEPPEPRVFLPAKGRVSFIVHRDVIDVGHARLDLASKARAALQVLSEYGAGQAVFTVIGQLQRVRFVAAPANTRRN